MQPQSNRLLIVVGATVIAWIFRVSLAGLACLSNPCLNGICIDDINSSFICFCADGFTGELCGTNWDECWSSPCENGGSCTDSIAAFNCSCPPGFSGERCEWNVDECASNPCLNGGSCIDQENGFVCSCSPGYAGHFCAIDVSVCNISYPMPHIPGPRCFNGGICLDGPGPNFTCVCADGWTGSRCELQSDECISAPCKNGGLCIDLLADFSCACPFGYTGKTCEMTLQMCRGINGTRINIFGAVTEESLLEEDEEDICENGALCLIESDGEKVCYCVPDYHGDRCQFRYDECLLAESSSWFADNSTEAGSGGHCQNGGECIDGVDSFTCSCPANYTGRFCECPVFILPGTDVPPDCLNTTTEYIPSTTSSSLYFTAKTPTTSTLVFETTTLPGLETTQETYSKTSVETSQTTLAFTSTTEGIYSTVMEGKSHVTDVTKEITEIGASTTTSTPATISTTSTTLHTEFFTGESSTADTETTEISTKSVTESSTQITSTLRDVIGEDKKWFTEGMTAPDMETTSSVITYTDVESTTPTTNTLSSLTTETVTEEVHSERTTYPMVDATKVIDEVLSTTSTKTDQTTFPSTLPGVSEMTTVRTTTDFIPQTESSSITKATVTEVDDAFVSTEVVEVTQTTDLLVTYLYTSEKPTFVPSEVLTEEITFSSITTEKLEEPEYFPSTKSQIDEGITFPEDFTSTPPEITTGESLYTEHTRKHTIITEETPSSTYTETHSTPIVDVHVIPEEQSERPEYTTTTEVTQSTKSFTATHPTTFTPIVTEESDGKTELPISEEQFTTTGDMYTTVILDKTEAVTDVTPKIFKETTSYKPLDASTPTTSAITTTVGTFTKVTTLSLSGEDDHTVPITTEPTDESVSTELGCNVTPCLNGGTCYYNECECTFKFTGTLCEKKKYIEVASFNGHSYLLHFLNISEFHDQTSHGESVALEDTKVNFKRHSDMNSASNKSHSKESETTEIEEEYMDMFEETYDFYEDHSYDFSSYDYYESDEPVESRGEKEPDHKDPLFFNTEKVNNGSRNSTLLDNINLEGQDISPTNLSSFNLSTTAISASLNVSQGESDGKSSNHTTTESVGNASSLELTTEDTLSKLASSSTPSTRKKERGNRSLRSLPPISTTISVNINLQERSLRVGGWGLVMKVTLGNMAKASLTINHSTGLLRFHFTCGLGRSLLFGEEDGQRWASLSRQQPVQSMIIPVLVALEVFRYEAVYKNNPSGGRSYLQCAASLKINGQVAVKGQQRAPMPKTSPSRKDSSQFYLYLGGIPEILLPCNHAVEDSMSSHRSSYEQKDHDEEEEGFVGCMQDLKINGVPRQIFEDALDGNSITECSDKILTGKESDVDVNPCFSFPCFGSSTCEPTGNGSWRCRCPTGWHGNNCEHTVCDNNPCLYGATCLPDDAGGFACLCPLGKGGRFCENDLEITKPCFDSGNGWDVEEHQPYLAYPLDHNHLSSPQLVFRFKFSPASINQIGLLAYIGDLKLPKSIHKFHPSLLSELKDSYLETTTFPTTLESSQRVEYPTHSPKDLVSDVSQSIPSQILHDADTIASTESVEQENGTPTEDTLKSQDFLPPIDIPLFQDEGPSYLQNFSSSESFSSYSNYLFSPFSPYPYYVRQNGRDHMAVSYIRGHLVLTWDLGSGPRRIFTSKPIPNLNEENVEITDDALFNTKEEYNQPLSMDKGSKNISSVSDIEIKPFADTNSSNSAMNPSDLRSSAYIVGSDKVLSSKSVKKALAESKVNTSKENYPPKSSENSNHSQILELGLNISFNQTYSLSGKEIMHLNSTFSNGNVTSAKEVIKEHQGQTVNSTRIHSIGMKKNDSEPNKTNTLPYSDSISSERKPIPSPERYHEVTVWREGQQAWLKVGDQVVRGQSPGRHYQLNAHRPFLYLGGHDAVNVSSLPHDIPLHSSFSGCIFDASLRFGGGHTVMSRRVPLFTKGRGVGECGHDPCKTASKSKESDNPCLNGGKCIPRGPTFICICKMSWFGPLCADSGHNPCDEGLHSCKHGSTCVSQPFGGYKCDCLPGTYGLYCEKEAPIGWSVKLSGQRSFLGVRIPFRGWRKRPASISLPERSKKEAFCIDLEIKPNRPNNGGIVLYIMGSHQDEFLALSINNKGEPELRIGPGSSRMVGPLVIGFNGKFQKENINQEDEKASLRLERNEELSQLSAWRKIRIFRRGLRVFLAMDGLLHGAGTLNEPSQTLPSIRPYNNSLGASLPLLYLGGLPDLAMLPQNAVGDVKMARPFAGCIRNVAVNWQKVPLGEGSGSYGRNAFAC